MLRLLPTPADLRRAADVIASGGVVIFPTETFHGLAADPRQPAAVARVIALKGRPDADARLDDGPTAGGPPSNGATVEPDGRILGLRAGACDVLGTP